MLEKQVCTRREHVSVRFLLQSLFGNPSIFCDYINQKERNVKLSHISGQKNGMYSLYIYKMENDCKYLQITAINEQLEIYISFVT